MLRNDISKKKNIMMCEMVLAELPWIDEVFSSLNDTVIPWFFFSSLTTNGVC